MLESLYTRTHFSLLNSIVVEGTKCFVKTKGLKLFLFWILTVTARLFGFIDSYYNNLFDVHISQWSSYQYVCAFQHSLNLTGCGIYICSWKCVIQNHVVSCDCVNNVFHTLIDLHLVMYLIWRRNIDFQRRYKECIVKCDTSTVFCKCRVFFKIQVNCRRKSLPLWSEHI